MDEMDRAYNAYDGICSVCGYENGCEVVEEIVSGEVVRITFDCVSCGARNDGSHPRIHLYESIIAYVEDDDG